MQLDITGGYYESDSLPISAQRLINAYVNVPQTRGALSQEVIFGTPGVTQVATTGVINEANRGLWVMAGIPYVVNGDKLYTLADDNTLAAVGTIAGTGRVSMADNGTQLCVLVPGGNGYIYNKDTTTFSQITDLDFTANGNPQYVVFNDGYFIFSTDSKKFINSALNDGLSYNALDVGTAEADPDDIVAPWAFKGRLYMGGSITFEPFRNIASATGSPYERIPGALLNTGIFAPFSLVDGKDHFYWVGGGKNEKAAIYRSSGQTPEKVSTTAIDKALQALSDDDLADVFAYSSFEDGQRFIFFRLPDTCFVLDEINGRWHERISTYINNEGLSEDIGYRVSGLIRAFGRTFVADVLDGRIGEIDKNVYTEYENARVQRRLITPPFEAQNEAFFMPRVELTMESGVGNSDEPDPQIRMSFSEDLGATFSPERSRDVRKKRQIWRRNGRFSKASVIQWEFSAPCKFVAIRADAKVIVGSPRYAS
jgi:hypothetical protein